MISSFRNFYVLFSKTDKRSPTSLFNTSIRGLVESSNNFIDILLSLGFDDFHCFLFLDFKWLHSLRKGVESSIVTDVGAETANSDKHIYIFKYTHFFWKFEKVHCFLKSDGFDHLSSS